MRDANTFKAHGRHSKRFRGILLTKPFDEGEPDVHRPKLLLYTTRLIDVCGLDVAGTGGHPPRHVQADGNQL